MANITHTFVNPTTDWTQTDVDAAIARGELPAGTLAADMTKPSDWNANHAVSDIVNADISASAAIDASKIADGSVSSTEFQYINTLSSNAQTQLNGKQGAITLTTTGSSGAATLVGDTLNIPQYSGGGGAVDSVNGQTGVVVLDADDISDAATTNKFTTASDISKLAGIEAGADVTDATNVTAAGALMDSEVTNLEAVKAFDPTAYATAAQGALADSAVQPSDLATVATTGSYNDLSDKPTIPTGTIDGTLTTNELVYGVDGNTVGSLAVATYPSLTEISYVKGVTSAIQTQLNGKQASGSYITASSTDTLTNKDLTSGTNTFPTFNQNTTGSSASCTGNAATVTNATLSTALTVNTGTVTLTGNVANTSVLTVGAGAVSVSGANTGDQTNISGNAATVTTNANLTGVITSSGNATSITSQTGTGSKFVVDTSPVLVTPTIGVATATSVNKVAITAPATSATLTIANGKTLTANNSITLAGTDATTMTFPTTSATIARTDAANTFTGVQTFNTAIGVASGGTGLGTLTANNVILGAGTSTPTFVAPSTSGNVLTSNGTTWTSAAPAGGTSVVSVKKQTFIASGTYTPSTGMLYCVAEVVGGGGGGAGVAAEAGSGGGAGGYGWSLISAATIGASKAVTIGAGGSGGSGGGGAATDGGTSSLGALISCTGGIKGTRSATAIGSAVVGGAGGVASSADVNVDGMDGGWGAVLNSSKFISGRGGDSPFGKGGMNIVSGSGGAATGKGAGGGGGTNSNGGGNGTDGFIRITEYCSQ
ncbi:MAG: hypothetical protein KA770_00220 [Shewanella sp.]|nr:hypothetical protein [Shewanella sp.]